ncbi:hypothetical protein KZX45_08955 [Georgenia sp. EYE_87]|uniref:hypothetical protein n=1 Tax=Georgenia sp. EYE_87 TaxID=2853448 RepID=UPI002002D1F2|nr:hypothetical protein [Georgenia sp. EYE_87]MCK6210667.1 hypothetical protein [Georgenia sp. EYE_87]
MSRTRDAAPVTDLTGLTGGSLRYGRRVPHSRPQWWRAASWMVRMHAYLGLWFWAIVLVVALTAAGVVSRVAQIEVSILQFAAHGALWFPFSLMITVVAVQLTAHVGNGMTRGSFVRAALLAAAATGLTYGSVLAVGLAVEGAIYDGVGWPHLHVATTGPGADDVVAPWSLGLPTSAFVYAVRTAGGAVAGLLVGITYYRLGGLRGTLLLPLTVLPAIVGQDDLAARAADAVGVSLPLYTLATLAVLALAAWAFSRLTRNAPVAHPRS